MNQRKEPHTTWHRHYNLPLYTPLCRLLIWLMWISIRQHSNKKKSFTYNTV